MKVYVVYLLDYTGSNELEILGTFNTIEKAEQCYLKTIEDNIKDFDFCYDRECYHQEYRNGKMSRLFKGGYQENWDNYIEVHIEESEVK